MILNVDFDKNSVNIRVETFYKSQINSKKFVHNTTY